MTFLTDKKRILAWLARYDEKFDNDPGAYHISVDGVVSVTRSVMIGNHHLGNLRLTELQVQFGEVSGFFSCGANPLTSLLGCPKRVTGYFNINALSLTSLDHLPTSIGTGLYLRGKHHLTRLLGIMLVEDLQQVDLTNVDEGVIEIFNKHLAGDRDIFACQQDLIDAGFEEYAQL